MSATLKEQREFIQKALPEAVASKHIWPGYAVAEAALESGYGKSQLARKCCNLFGQKQGRKVPLPYPTIDWRTKEVKAGSVVWEPATWLRFPDWATSFKERMELLRRLDLYRPALAAQTGEEYVREVSGYWAALPDSTMEYRTRWATDPLRAEKVLDIYEKHKELLTSLEV